MSEATSQPLRRKVPKDGPGPRGVPECYYTSRVLNSTFRYAKFVRKLRAEEEEQRKGAENKLKELKDKQTSDFFIHCDRKSYINDVARRVDLCMASYEEDLKAKRRRLIELFQREEEANIRKFVEQAQAGAEAVWQDKLDRLQYLLDKRKKEHEDKYKDTPLSKCVHVLPCIYKLRAKEAEEIQLYQIKEKEARKMAEKEFSKMWHEVAMKESEALAARMEQDVIERLRRDQECNRYSDYILEQRRIQREKEREMLKEESRRFKALWDAEIRKEEEAERQRVEKSKETALDRKRMLQEKQEIVAKQQQEAKLIADTWDSLAGQGLADEKAKLMLMRQKERELDECNRKMIELREQFADRDKDMEGPLEEEARQRQEMIDKKRCEYLGWAQKTNRVQQDGGDLHGLSQPTVSRICARVARAIARHSATYIKMPQTLIQQQKVIREFLEIRNFPSVLGCIDCTHIKIKKYGGNAAQYYINKKGFYSMNVQEVRQAMIDQIKDRQHAREVLKQKMRDQDEYQRLVFSQLSELSRHKDLTDAKARKKHQQDLVQQIEYNKLLKERARQEELDQIKKCQLATEEYQNEIGRMLCRPYFSDEIHPFMKQMAKGLEMKEKCPCSKPDYCK